MNTENNYNIVWLGRIWDEDAYNSFTDLIRFGDLWYCTFRQSDAHEFGRGGSIRLIVSADGRTWTSAAQFTIEEIDLRDPKLSITPQGQLMLRVDACRYGTDSQLTRDSRVCFSDDGQTFTPWETQTFDVSGEPNSDGHRLWRVSWHNDVAYGATALLDPERIYLCTSRDGLHFKGITRLCPEGSGKLSETTVRVLRDGTMLALVRQGWLGQSTPPYTHWSWQRAPKVGGPNFIELPDGRLFGSGREYRRDGTKRTILAEMTPTSYRPILRLPSDGDNSYAGMVWHEGRLWMSYYSQHEGGPFIYFAQIKLKSKDGKTS